MGARDGGLYDSDFARDLKGTIKAVLRAPLSDDEAMAEIWASHGKGEVEADALDYWLVLADQLERLGMRRKDVFERALAIARAGEDVAMLAQLGAEPKMLARRRKETAKLVERLRHPRPAKRRRPLQTPEPLLLLRGDALTWPTDKGEAINPYLAPDQLWKLVGFTPDGWGFGIVTDAGHHYQVLAYYAVQILKWRRPARPSPEFAAQSRDVVTPVAAAARPASDRKSILALGEPRSF